MMQNKQIEKEVFGATGHESTRTLFGAAALGKLSQKEADPVQDILDQYGVNHIDTAASYGDAELRLGPWMKHRRKEFFLATKTEKRSREGAWEELQRSLDRLQTDHVDLWQMHVLVKEEEWEKAMGPGGALEAFIEAKRQGLTRFIGVTGHGLDAARMHMKSLDRYPFDSVLLPWNFVMSQIPEYAQGFHRLEACCRDRGVALQTIKSIARHLWGDRPRNYATWYQPLTDPQDIERAVHWVLSQSRLFLNTAGDISLLPHVLEAASRRNTIDPQETESMVQWARGKGVEPIFPNPEDA